MWIHGMSMLRTCFWHVKIIAQIPFLLIVYNSEITNLQVLTSMHFSFCVGPLSYTSSSTHVRFRARSSLTLEISADLKNNLFFSLNFDKYLVVFCFCFFSRKTQIRNILRYFWYLFNILKVFFCMSMRIINKKKKKTLVLRNFAKFC